MKSRCNSNLATIVLAKDVSAFTPAVVLSGHVNEPDDSHSLGACLRRFDREPIPMAVPGHTSPILCKGWLFNFVGDAPAVACFCGTKQSFSKAFNICNMCENAHKPRVIRRPSLSNQHSHTKALKRQIPNT